MSSDLMAAVHGALVLLLSIVILMLRSAQAKGKSSHGAGELYRRVEDAERRILEAIHTRKAEP